MNIDVDEHGEFLLTDVFSGVNFVTVDGEEFSIYMRDKGYEFHYGGCCYSAQKGEIKNLSKSEIDELEKALENKK